MSGDSRADPLSKHSLLMDVILLDLLTTLERIGDQHEELYDSEVRERIGTAVMEGFVRSRSDYVVPDDLGLLQPETNVEVRNAIVRFNDAANAWASVSHTPVFHDRLAALQNGEIRTVEGNYYDDFFGHSPPEYYDANGNCIR